MRGVVVGEVPGVLVCNPHAELHLGHVSRLDSVKAAKPEFHEVAGSKSRAFKLKTVTVAA